MKEPTSTRMLQCAAEALGDLRESMVFVGGAVVGLYATNPAAPPVRATLDVDCIVQVVSRRGYRQLEQLLEDRGFRHDTAEGAPVCRWLFGELTIDIMPTDQAALGFANRWHLLGFEHAVRHRINAKTEILLLPPPFFVAPKLEALHGRGGQDWRGAPDLEDLVFVLDNRPELPGEVSSAPECVWSYLVGQFAELLRGTTLREYVASSLPSATGGGRVGHVLAQMQEIADVASR